MAESVTIKANCNKVVSYARYQNGMKMVNRMEVKNTSAALLTDPVLHIESDPEVIHPFKLHIGDIRPGNSVVIDDIRADISAKHLSELTESQAGVLRITVSSDGGSFAPVTVSHPITILPYDQWEGVRQADELLASFCLPNHPDVKLIIQSASKILGEWTGDTSMDGYSSSDRVKKQAAAIFEAIKEVGISYSLPPASFYDTGQRIRMPEEIISTRLATCIDTSLLYASCLEAIDIRPLIVLFRSHAFVGFWLDEEATSPCVVNDDPALLRKRNAEGINQMIPVETTCMTNGDAFTFDKAVLKAEQLLGNTNQFECYVDIYEARKLGINPLPLRVRTPEGYTIVPDEPTFTECPPEDLPPTDHIDLSADPTVDKQTIWERKLLDLTLRNNLLNIHPRSILQLMDPDACSLVSAMENGRSMSVACSPEGWAGRISGCGIYESIPKINKMSAFADAEVRDSKLHTYLDEDHTATRMETLRDTAKRSMEESGANTLYLTVGTLKWFDTDRRREHFAPILLIPCEIIRKSFSVVASGEDVVFNLTLLEMLREDFGITIPGLCDLPEKDGHIDVRLILNTVRKAVMDRKGWDVDPLVFLGNFTFSKFIIWNDIHTGRDAFDAHPLVGSFKKGVLDRRIAPLGDAPADIDSTCPPDRILLPVEADSSQMKAIRDALDGCSFVMQGPPGTGKSQTITNIIANAVYHGKRVLFVSEKKAALEVVQKRLESIGLGPLCLELHSNKARKSLVLDKMEKTLELKAPTGCSTFAAEARSLAERRSEVNSHAASLHTSAASGTTLYGALSRYLSSDAAIPCLNLPREVIESLSPEKVRQMKAAVRDYAAAVGHVSMDGIRDLLDLPLDGYTPALSESLRAEMEKLLSTQFPLFFWLRSLRLSRMLGHDVWSPLGLKGSSSRRDKVRQWHGSIGSLRDYAIYNTRRNAMRSLGLGLMASEYERGAVGAEAMPESLTKSLDYGIARYGIDDDTHLSMFCGDLFSNTASDYREAERMFMDGCRSEIRRKMYGDVAALSQETDNPELTILRRAMRNGARGMSLRTLFSKIPNVLPRLCPCMLMSPLSVAQYLTADAGLFDIVIFDEASQMQTCEAIGSIGRGRSVIVAGDSKQLPPTTFFETLSFDLDNADREDMESVLEECTALSVPSNMLRWHYRSRHESLIAFSNSKYYANSLLTFPSNDDLTSKVGLCQVDGEYDRGGSRQNRKEAEAVVAEVKRRLELEPERSIGVITFSQPQQVAVEKRLETMLRNNPGLDQIASSMAEPIFVKNLENVQGDERDVILFSVGYGTDKQGRLPMNFGPLNQKGGWRRLNVAVSRARYEMKVFSSLRPDDIRVDFNTPKGVEGLRDFLRYAAEGRPCLEERDTQTSVRDEWVEKIAEGMRSEGMEVNTNVGSSDFRIDLAVLDPEKEGCYSYGIICDGPNYASSPSAVDREVVRPSILESLGWNIKRRWIMDEWNSAIVSERLPDDRHIRQGE